MKEAWAFTLREKDKKRESVREKGGDCESQALTSGSNHKSPNAVSGPDGTPVVTFASDVSQSGARGPVQPHLKQLLVDR
ncbi:hypothetical protein DPEC_G00057910 [Dallia pectoralis]|uniref:Uncharacterized protein n=1 Tax=Dallia pectoralis TaxID=75939 RepID=A0ACC2H5Z7_DALPE|nr:hypothetical protein DPEC_G00057910 [Dallia pectoralis]